MKHEINFFQHYKDNVVGTAEHLSWDEVTDLFSSHTVSSNKDGYMFNFCEFKRTDFAPAERKIFVDGIDTGERVLKLDANGNLQIGRCADNVLSYNCLVLDYDGNGATLEKIITRFSGYRHLGYTSYNHVIKGVDKMRVVLPFETICPIDEWHKRTASFLQFAGEEIDNSTIAVSRPFYLPSCSADTTQYAECWHVDGVTLDWNYITPTQTYTVPSTSPAPINDVELNEILDELQKHVPLMPYEMRFKLVRAVAQHVSKADAINAMRSRWHDGNLNGKYEAMLSAPLKAGGPTLASAIFEIRKYNPTFKKSNSSTIDNYGETRIHKSMNV